MRRRLMQAKSPHHSVQCGVCACVFLVHNIGSNLLPVFLCDLTTSAVRVPHLNWHIRVVEVRDDLVSSSISPPAQPCPGWRWACLWFGRATMGTHTSYFSLHHVNDVTCADRQADNYLSHQSQSQPLPSCSCTQVRWSCAAALQVPRNRWQLHVQSSLFALFCHCCRSPRPNLGNAGHRR